MSKINQFKFEHKVFEHLGVAHPTATGHYLRSEEPDCKFCVRFKKSDLGFEFPNIKEIPIRFSDTSVSIHGSTENEAHENTYKALRFVQQSNITVEKYIAISVSDRDITANGWRGLQSGVKEVLFVAYEIFTKTTRTIGSVTTTGYYTIDERKRKKPHKGWQVIPYTEEAEAFLIHTHKAMQELRSRVQDNFATAEKIQALIQAQTPLIGGSK